MKIQKIVQHLFHLSVSMLLLLSACTEYPPIHDIPETTPSPSPVISKIFPAGAAIAGVREITIAGKNFAVNNNDTNWIYIGGRTPKIKSITADTIVVFRPPVYGDSLLITISIPTANVSTNLKYKIENPISQFGDLARIPRNINLMEIDKGGNLWITAERYIYKVTADGLNSSQFIPDTVTKATIGSAMVPMSDMKFSKDFIYFTIGTKSKIMYRFSTIVSDTPRQFITIPSTGNVDKFDFDSKGNIYAGTRNSGVYFVDRSVDTNKVFSATGRQMNKTFTDIRVFNNYLYSADSKSISRNAISAGGTLGADEPIVNLSTISGMSACDISSFSIDSAGTIYMSLKNHPTYVLFVLENNGSVTPFYEDDILPNSLDQIFWDNDRYLYLNRGISTPSATRSTTVRLFRIGMERKGAPYLGRLLP